MTDDEVQAKREDQAEQARVAEGASREESKVMSETPKPVPAPNVPTRDPTTPNVSDRLLNGLGYGLGFCLLIVLWIVMATFSAWQSILGTVLAAFLVCRWTEHGWLAALACGVVGWLIAPSVKGKDNATEAEKSAEALFGCSRGVMLLSWYTAIGALTVWAMAFFG